ncbi:flagellar protein FliI [Burkholderia ubonensis]|uniref:FliI/YscN family ATPase n=1 Tax=Burkholderia ubonensis TaxID=101571 RepID=UPI0007539814|nr:FliI/YscN family ATPase [Burkholderia ubonensis]KVO87463.1 flagellar protein FliI [Burkholderia ubonensis]KVZ56865.1 flagellar protein FliI [Burkholderia ubonensis]KVZ71899.1 flagellar protein FliI [Burkholderia ubonensis]
MPERLSGHRYVEAMRRFDPVARLGTVTRIMPTFIEADGPGVPVGTLCVVSEPATPVLYAEVTGAEVGRITLAPYQSVASLRIGDTVRAIGSEATLPVGAAYLGRIVDPLGTPLDGGPPITSTHPWPLAGFQTPPLDRTTPDRVLETGVRAIDTMLTLGAGQRIGIFAGSGVGKTTLLATLARHVDADVCVLCLVGERGREAEDFWHRSLGDAARARSVMVIATSDQPAILRARGVSAALAHAEYFRAQGRHVLLLLDSVTRYALALREIGLAAGEPPTLRAYTPSVFAALPKIVERCGVLRSGGAITALMTVLTETDEIDDPMAETMRALLDGHLVLTRALAEQGHFPAIDVTRSISRIMQHVADDNARGLAARALAGLSRYERSRTLIEAGLYVAGTHPDLDDALRVRPDLITFLRQDAGQATSRDRALALLRDILGVRS